MNRLLSMLLVLCSVFLIFSFSTEAVSQDEGYYRAAMRENGIDRVTGKSFEELDAISARLRAYLKEGDNALLTPHFSESEVAHMVDVYGLFDRMRTVTVLVIALGAAIFYILSIRNGFVETAHWVGKSALTLLVLLAIFSGLVAINFHAVWFKFHQVFFSNELWLMDPARDLMIQMLPEPFFFGMVKRIGFALAAGLVALGALTFLKGEDNATKSIH